jgi:hypothetical protein
MYVQTIGFTIPKLCITMSMKMLVTKPFLLLRSWSGRSSIMTSPCQESIKTKYLSSTFKNVTVQLTLIRKLQIDRDTTTWKIQGERRRFERKRYFSLALSLRARWNESLHWYNFEYLRLESGREILIGQML